MGWCDGSRPTRRGRSGVSRPIPGERYLGTAANPALRLATISPTIAEALTLGGSKLAVDGVVIIAEHGTIPPTKKGRCGIRATSGSRRSSRSLKTSGRAVRYSTTSTYRPPGTSASGDGRRRQAAGIPISGRLLAAGHVATAIDRHAVQRRSQESVCVAYGGIDSYDFHALETAQCMSERRRGGEVGMRGAGPARRAIWQHWTRTTVRSRATFVAALTRSHNLPVEGGFHRAGHVRLGPPAFPTPRATLSNIGTVSARPILLTGIRDFNYAGYLAARTILSCQMYLPMPTTRLDNRRLLQSADASHRRYLQLTAPLSGGAYAI